MAREVTWSTSPPSKATTNSGSEFLIDPIALSDFLDNRHDEIEEENNKMKRDRESGMSN